MNKFLTWQIHIFLKNWPLNPGYNISIFSVIIHSPVYLTWATQDSAEFFARTSSWFIAAVFSNQLENLRLHHDFQDTIFFWGGGVMRDKFMW